MPHSPGSKPTSKVVSKARKRQASASPTDETDTKRSRTTTDVSDGEQNVEDTGEDELGSYKVDEYEGKIKCLCLTT